MIDSLSATTEEIQDINGCWYSVGVRPYRTVDERIAGAVITFQDIDPLKRGLQASEEAREYAEALIETVREPLAVLDADLRVQRATAAFYETFLVSREETEGRHLYDLGNGQWNQPRLRELLGCALFKSEPFQDYEVQHDCRTSVGAPMRLNARRFRGVTPAAAGPSRDRRCHRAAADRRNSVSAAFRDSQRRHRCHRRRPGIGSGRESVLPRTHGLLARGLCWQADRRCRPAARDS